MFVATCPLLLVLLPLICSHLQSADAGHSRCACVEMKLFSFPTTVPSPNPPRLLPTTSYRHTLPSPHLPSTTTCQHLLLLPCRLLTASCRQFLCQPRLLLTASCRHLFQSSLHSRLQFLFQHHLLLSRRLLLLPVYGCLLILRLLPPPF